MEWANVVELTQTEPGDQPAHRDAAEFSHGVRRDSCRIAFENQSAFPRQRLGLHADVFWIEIFRARIHGAEVALATIERGDHRIRAHGKAQRLHGAMRLDRMPEQKARTEFRAEAALIAC